MRSTKLWRSLVWVALGIGAFALAFLAGHALASGSSGRETQPDGSSALENQSEQSRSRDSSADEPATEEAEPGVTEAQQELPDLARREPEDPLALGREDAPIVLIEYADYRCPFCGVFARETLPVLISEYVDQGLLRIEWRDAPIFGPESFEAAVAARAAGQQGLFWEYYSELFAYEGSGHQSLPRSRLLEIAQEIGVPDMELFESDLDNDELSQAVGHDYAEAQTIGIYSTPAFLVGDVPVMGAQPLEFFQDTIDKQLKSTGVDR